jgi:SAM-dependent methyltransferase
LSEPIVLPTQEGYDRWAEIYDGEGNPLIAMEEPVVDRLLGEIAGLAVVDVGCGTGRHALRLAERGANVVGVDFSDGMLARARAKEGASAVRWVVHDVTRRRYPCPPMRSIALCALSSSITSATSRRSSPSWAA